MTALTDLVNAQAPANRPMTLAEVEQAVFDLLKQIGTQLTTEVLAEQIARTEKRGSGQPVADTTCAGLTSVPGRC